MGHLAISITPRQHRVLMTKIRLAGKGSLESEIQRAIDQYLAGTKQIEAAFFTLLKCKAPKDLPDLPALQAKLKKTHEKIDRTLARVKASERRVAAMDAVDVVAVGRLALETFGSAKQAYAWMHRPHKTLGQRTPVSLLTNASGFKRVEILIKRRAHDIQSHGESSR